MKACPGKQLGGDRDRDLVSPNRDGSAFTLIELLVVIAIIGVLASLLFPAISRAKAEGAKAACISNFRQLHLAWQMYAHDNADHFPYNDVAVGSTALPLGNPSWVWGMMSVSDNWRDNTNVDLLLKVDGGIGPYLKEPKVFKCPSDRSVAKINGIVSPRVRSVAMNDFMGTQIGLDPNEWLGSYYPTAQHLLRRPPVENGWVFIDTHEDSIETGLFTVTMNGPWWNYFPGSRHNGGATVSFTDGHIVCHRWVDGRTRQPVTGKFLYGQKQPGNPDIRWVQERATVLKSAPGP